MLSPVSSAAAPHTAPAKPEPQTLPCMEHLASLSQQHDLPAGDGSGCVLPSTGPAAALKLRGSALGMHACIKRSA